jgi:CBS domain containing-hemolysin-like protein
MQMTGKFLRAALFTAALIASASARASLFSGDTLDFVADILAWVVLILAPIIAVTVFWLVHILPERIAEQRHHPQAAAIKTLCLLSLFFGGLLWPLAWLWAYSQPVLYKMAYGVDKVKPVHGDQDTLIPSSQPHEPEAAPSEAAAEVVPEPAPRVTRTATRERRPWET